MLSDHLGSTSTTANADGTWNSSIRYSAFGEIRASSGITNSNFRYTGQLRQAELGLYYYVARWYDPQTAHFTQADTIVQNQKFSGSYDRYAYVMNNPIRYTDPTGHACRDDGKCVLGPGDRLPAKSTLLYGGTNTSKTSSEKVGSRSHNLTLGLGFSQSIEEELFRWHLLFRGHISGGMTSSDSINTASDIALLLEQENGHITGVEFDSDFIIGGYNVSEGFMLGGRTPSLNYLFGLEEGATSNHFAGSCSVDLSKGLWNTEVTITIYPTDITTSAGAFEGEVMAGYYLNYTPAKLMATYSTAKVVVGVFVGAVFITRGALLPIINSFNNWAPKGATP